MILTWKELPTSQQGREIDGKHFLASFSLLVGFDILSSGSDLLDLAGVWVPGALARKGPLSYTFSLFSDASKAHSSLPCSFPFYFGIKIGVSCHCDLDQDWEDVFSFFCFQIFMCFFHREVLEKAGSTIITVFKS